MLQARREVCRAEPVFCGRRWQVSIRRFTRAQDEVGLLCVACPATGRVSLAELAQASASTERALLLGRLAVLSERELEVAALIGAGLTDTEVAWAVHRSVRTIHAHRRAIGRKLKLTRRAEIIEFMCARGLAAAPAPDQGTHPRRLLPAT